MRGSNQVIGLISLLSLLMSIPILWGGIWLSIRANNTECVKFLQWPLIIIAVCIMLTSLAGVIGACYRNTFLTSLYFLLMFFIILVLIGFIIFAYAVTHKGSGWLEKRVASDSKWGRISSCVRDSQVCAKLQRTFDGVPETAYMFYHTDLTPIQSGCCKPPTECGYIYEKETVWRPGGVVGSNPDCSRWSNDQYLLCYDCDSCKAGVLASLNKSWRKVSLINIVVCLALFFLYVIAFSVYRNNHKINNCEPCGETRMTKAQPS